jgi:F0F1-type ATP synthase epsilon subunit
MDMREFAGSSFITVESLRDGPREETIVSVEPGKYDKPVATFESGKKLSLKTSKGMRVIVMPRDVAPADITHPSLFKPKIVDVGLPALTVAGTTGQVSGVAPKHMQALRAIADAKASEVSLAAKKAEEARQAAVATGAEAVRFTKPLRMAERERTLAEAQLKEAEKAFDEATASSSGTTEKAAEVKAAATSRLTEAQTRLDSLKSGGQPKLDAAIAAREAANLAEAARVVAIVAAREANAKMLPVSVFISRETQRLYVRQAFQPVFDVPVTISETSSSIGTHVYTAPGTYLVSVTVVASDGTLYVAREGGNGASVAYR